jgi:hypothetical protein
MAPSMTTGIRETDAWAKAIKRTPENEQGLRILFGDAVPDGEFFVATSIKNGQGRQGLALFVVHAGDLPPNTRQALETEPTGIVDLEAVAGRSG